MQRSEQHTEIILIRAGALSQYPALCKPHSTQSSTLYFIGLQWVPISCINIKIHLAFCGANYLGFLALNKLEISVEPCAPPSSTDVWDPAQIPRGSPIPFDLVSHPRSCPLPLTGFLQRVTVQKGLEPGETCSGLPKEVGVRWLSVHTCVGARLCAGNVQAALVGIALIGTQLSCCSCGDRDVVRAS